MGMGVGGAHRRPLVLKDLHPAIPLAQFQDLLCPDVHHAPDISRGHFRQRQVVPGRKTDHATGASVALVAQQWVLTTGWRRVGQQGGKIVGKDIGGLVRRIALTAGPLVAGAQIAIGFVGRPLLRHGFSTCPRHGRFVRCGDTSTHSPTSGL